LKIDSRPVGCRRRPQAISIMNSVQNLSGDQRDFPSPFAGFRVCGVERLLLTLRTVYFIRGFL
jgi:hypothetical protein